MENGTQNLGIIEIDTKVRENWSKAISNLNETF